MNPAQFQNMGAMGGGMPNPMQQQMLASPNLTPQQITRNILQNLTANTQSLQAQGKFLDWHSTLQIEQRANQVKLLIDSLRLIQPVVTYDQAINVALTFEQKAFSQEPTREQYLATIKEKLGQIQDTRASQVQSQSNSLQQMMQRQPMSFNPQMQQRSVQQISGASRMVPQSMPQGQQGFNQGMVGQPGLSQQSMQQRASIQNRPNFNDDDNKNINQLAATMAQSMSNDDMRRIRENLSDQQKQQMAMKNVDPLAFYFRAQATKEYSRRKLAAQAQSAQNGGIQMQQQMTQNFGPPSSGSPFPGSLDRFQGQQADGMRSQEVGELVVPASNPQGMTPEQFQLHKQMLQNQQRQVPNGTPNTMLPQQPNQQNRQAQAQAQAQARAQAAARAQSGLPGQNNVQIPPQSNTPLSQINRSVGPNLQGTTAQNIDRAPSRPPQQVQPGMAGQPVPQQQQPIQDPQNALARFPTELQAILKQKPPNEWRTTAQAYMAQQKQMSMGRSSSQPSNGMAMQSAGQIQQLPSGQFLGGATPMQSSLSSGAMPTQGQPPRSQPESAQQMLQQQQQQRQIHQSQELARQRQFQINQIQQQQFQNQQQQVQLQQQLQAVQPQQQGQSVGPPLTPAQMAYMDQQAAHENIAKNLLQHQQWSPAIKTWGQLKQWLQRYPITTLPISRIEEVQRIQFGHMLAARQKQAQQQQQQQRQQQMLQGQQQQQVQQSQRQQHAAGLGMGQPGMQTPRMQSQQQMSMNMQVRPTMPQQLNPPNNMTPQVKSVTVEEIANARRMNPQFQNLPDARIGQFIHSQRVKAVQNRLNEQNQPPTVFMPVQTGQSQQPGSQMVRQPSAGGARPGPPQQVQGLQRPPSARPTPAGSQVPAKNLKRPNDVENVPTLQGTQQGNRPQQQLPPGGIPNLSKEQFEKLPPAQQQRFMAMKRMEQRNKEAGLAILQLTKEVQGTLPQRKGIANMSAANKARAAKLLTQDQTKNMLGRFDPFIVQFLSLSNDRETTKQLLGLRLQLMPQYKAQSFVNKTYEAADQFCMTADQIEAAITEMFQKFQMTLQKSTQMRQQSQNVQSQGPPAPQQLTPGNLELLEQQEAQRRNSKTSKGKDVPPAPTTSQPPFTFGDTRGQGTPKYASVGLKQEDLKLDPKRRKRNPTTGATPITPNAPAAATKPSPAVKTEQQGRRFEPEMPFKCPIPACEYQTKGFATQPELDMHTITAHRPIEVDDPITFFIDNMHRGLGLDDSGQPSPKKSDIVQPRSLPMQKTASTASAAIKAEVMSKPSTPVAHTTSVPSARPFAVDSDPWFDANVKPELLHDVFSGPDPFSTELDLDEFVRVYKQSEQWKDLPPANPEEGFCAEWKEPDELQETQEKKQEARLARLAGGDIKSPPEDADNDFLVDLKIDGLDLRSDHDWEEIENMDLDTDFDVDMGSPWESVTNVEDSASSTGQVLSSEELMKIPWDELMHGDSSWAGQQTKHADYENRSHASYESLDWGAMFADEDNIVQGTSGMQVKRAFPKSNTVKAAKV